MAKTFLYKRVGSRGEWRTLRVAKNPQQVKYYTQKGYRVTTGRQYREMKAKYTKEYSREVVLKGRESVTKLDTSKVVTDTTTGKQYYDPTIKKESTVTTQSTSLTPLASADKWKETLTPRQIEQIESGEIKYPEGSVVAGGKVYTSMQTYKIVMALEEGRRVSESFKDRNVELKKAKAREIYEIKPQSQSGLVGRPVLTTMAVSPSGGSVLTGSVGLTTPVIATQYQTSSSLPSSVRNRLPTKPGKLNQAISSVTTEKIFIVSPKEGMPYFQEALNPTTWLGNKANVTQAQTGLKTMFPTQYEKVSGVLKGSYGMAMANLDRIYYNIKYRPGTAAVMFGIGAGVGTAAALTTTGGTRLAAAGFTRLGTTIAVTPKVAGYAAMGIYGGTRGTQLYFAKSPQERGRIMADVGFETVSFGLGYKFGTRGVQNIKDYKVGQKAAHFQDSLTLQQIKYGSGKAWDSGGSLGTRYISTRVGGVTLGKGGKVSYTIDTMKTKAIPKGARATSVTGRGDYQLSLSGRQVKGTKSLTVKVRQPGRATFDTYSTKQTFAMEQFKIKAAQFYKYDSSIPKLTSRGVFSPREERLFLASQRGGVYNPGKQTKLTQFSSDYIDMSGKVSSKKVGFLDKFIFKQTVKKNPILLTEGVGVTRTGGTIQVPKSSTVLGGKISPPQAVSNGLSFGNVSGGQTIIVGGFNFGGIESGSPTTKLLYPDGRSKIDLVINIKKKPRTQPTTAPIIIQEPKSGESTTTTILPIQKTTPITSTKSTTTQDTTVIPDIIPDIIPPVRPVPPPPDRIDTPPPPPPPGSPFGSLSSPYFPKSKKKPSGGGSIFKPSYMPSVEALFLNIRGKKPKEEELMMGIRMRPLIKRKRGKRK